MARSRVRRNENKNIKNNVRNNVFGWINEKEGKYYVIEIENGNIKVVLGQKGKIRKELKLTVDNLSLVMAKIFDLVFQEK